MTFDEMTQAVDAGKTVRWYSSHYVVIKDSIGNYILYWHHGQPDEGTLCLNPTDMATIDTKEYPFYCEGDKP